MIAITQEHITYFLGLIGIAGAIKSVFIGIDRKLEKNNETILSLIDKKLDIKIYEEHKKNFEKWSNEKDKILEEKLNKLEYDIKDELKDIKESLKEINSHMINCKN